MVKFGVLVGVVVLSCVTAWGQQGGGFQGSPQGDGVSYENGMYVYRGGGILTTAEDAPYPVKMKAGGTLAVLVTSNEFDAAVKVTDEAGKTLVENDDAAPGTQNAQLVFRADKDGTYKVMVEAFKSKAGGHFRVEIRHFQSVVVKVGDKVGLPKGDQPTFVSTQVKRGQVVYLEPENHRTSPFVVVLPNGSVQDARQAMRVAGQYGLFQAQQDGEYFVGYRELRNDPDVIRTREVKPVTVESGGKVPATEGQLVDWLMVKGKKDEAVMLQIPDGATAAYWDDGLRPLADAIPEEGLEFGKKEESNEPPAVRIEAPRKHPALQPLIFSRDGEMPVLVMRDNGKGDSSVRPLAESFSIGGSVTKKLAVNDDLYFQIDGKKNDWFDFGLTSTDFDPKVEFYTSDGRRLVDVDDTDGGLDIRQNMFVTETRSMWVRVHCSGGGGGGMFTFSTTVVPVPVFPASGVLEADIDARRPYAWSMALKAGEAFLLRYEGELTAIQVSSEVDGAFKNTTGLIVRGQRYLLVEVGKDAPGRLWLSGKGHVKVSREKFEIGGG